MPTIAGQSTRIVTFPGAKGDLAQKVYRNVSTSKSLLQSEYWRWYDAIEQFRGEQWTYWDSAAGRVRPMPVMPWRLRVTDNQIMPLLQMQLALLLERQPTYRAMARTVEENDIEAALGFEALLIYQWDRCDKTQKLASALHASLTTGNGFWRLAWNSSAGKPVGVPTPVGESLAGARGAPKHTDPEQPDDDFYVPGMPEAPRQLFEGDISVECVSPFSMHVDTSARDMSEARWACQESFVHIDVLTERFGKAVTDKLSPDVTADEFYQYESNLRFESHSAGLLDDDRSAAVRVLEYWEAPTKKDPEGRVTTAAGGDILNSRKSPYGGRMPFVHFPCIKVHGRFWADGMVKHLKPLQALNNSALSRFHEIMNLMANPKWVIDKGAGLKETTINDRPGEVIVKNPGSEVVAVAPPPVPTIHPQIMSIAMNSMQTISGVNDPLVGNNPAGVRSGRSLAFLQESGMRRFIPMALQTEHALRQAGRFELFLCQKFYDEERTVRILGEDQRPRVWRMGKAEVGRIEDVTIVHGSLIPKSRAAQQDNVLELIQRAPALLTDDDGIPMRDWVLEKMDMPAATGRLSPHMEARAHIKGEHVAALEGEPLTVQPWENDILHMRGHGSWLNGAEARANPEAMKAVAAHYFGHEKQHQMKMGGGMVDINGVAAPQGEPEQGPGAPPLGGQGGPTPPGGPGEGLPQPDPGAGFPGGSR